MRFSMSHSTELFEQSTTGLSLSRLTRALLLATAAVISVQAAAVLPFAPAGEAATPAPVMMKSAAAASTAAAFVARPQAQRPLQGSAKKGEAVKRRLLELFGLCSANRAVAAAAYFVYRGPDGSRKWKDTLNPAVADERRDAADICLRIKGYLDASRDYEFRTFHVEREPEGKWNVWEVWFRQGDGTKKVIFAFLSIKGCYSIGDID